MNNYTSLVYAVQHRLVTITLNRPERRNALDDVMIKELSDAVAAANRANDIRMIILTSTGSSFCAGMDLAYLQKFSQLGHEENLEDAKNLMKLLLAIYTSKKPVIAMVNGPAMGGGCGLLAACDFIYASREKAKIGVPEVRLGFLPALILVFLIKRMGEGRAKELVLKGEILDAATAKERGLITEVIDDAHLSPSVYEFAENFCTSTSPSSITLTKDLFARFNEMNLKDALDYAANLNALTRKTEDFAKGINSFIAKEKLEW